MVARKQTDQIKTIAEGRVWTGQDALKIGLVDKIGGIDEAIKIAGRKSQTNGISGERVSWKEDFATKFMKSFGEDMETRFIKAVGENNINFSAKLRTSIK